MHETGRFLYSLPLVNGNLLVRGATNLWIFNENKGKLFSEVETLDIKIIEIVVIVCREQFQNIAVASDFLRLISIIEKFINLRQ